VSTGTAPSPPTSSYGQRLQAGVARRGALCVGVDPHPAILRAWGLDADAAGLERCARGLVEALGDSVAVFKPQSAFFEAYGSAGVAVLERVLADIRAAGALSLLDVKRGDIGSTMDAYAAAYLSDGSPLAADAITLSPYLGFGSLRGAIDLAGEQGRGVYVLALTSNPEAPELQHAVTARGVGVAQSIIDAAAEANSRAGSRAGAQLGHVGLVVGATIGRTGIDFAAVNGSILAPGLGAQGAGAADLVDVFGSALPLVLPSMSREVLSAGPEPEALRAAARRAAGEMKALSGVGVGFQSSRK
jgi:orotidine-5'-phosphate decarboxylase